MMKNKFFLAAGVTLALVLALFPAGAFAAKKAISIDASPASTTIKAGETVTWTVTATYDDASTEDVSSFALFDIPTSAGGTLSANTYTSEIPGTYSIPVTVGIHPNTVSLTVVHGDPISLELNQSATTMVAGSGSVTFTGTLLDSVGNTWDTTGQMTLTSDEESATIANTSFTSTKTGIWTITATAGEFTASRQVTVTPDTATAIAISGDTTRSLELDKDTTLSAELTDQYGNKVTGDITWSSSSDVVTVDADGKVTAKTIGTATITATNGELSSPVEFTIAEATPADTDDKTTTNANTETNTNTEDTENTEDVSTDENGDPLISLESTDATDDENEECNKLELWIFAIIFLVYALILFGYYTLIKHEEDKSWWIFPALLTIIGLIIWNKYLCPEAVQWFPWFLIAIGLAVTGYGRGQMRKTGSSGNIPPPTDEPQKPMF